MDDKFIRLWNLLEEVWEWDSKVIAVFDFEIKMDRERMFLESLNLHVDEATCETQGFDCWVGVGASNHVVSWDSSFHSKYTSADFLSLIGGQRMMKSFNLPDTHELVPSSDCPSNRDQSWNV